MSLTRILFLSFALLCSLMAVVPDAWAANCWKTDPAVFEFGAVTAGEAAQTTDTIEYQCNDYDSNAEYIRLCLNLDSDSMIEMNTNPANVALHMMLYPADDPATDLATGYAQQDIKLESMEANSSHRFSLIAKIPAGQTDTPSGDYFIYEMTRLLTLKYAYAESQEQLPACSAITDNTMTDTFYASATVKAGCALVSVDAITFGSKSPVMSTQLNGETTGNITVRCPVNTDFTVAIGPGMHSDGDSRRMCNGDDCVAYELYQDAAHSMPWNDSNSIQTQTAETGDNMTITVYARLPPQQWVPPGDYRDTVVVTLSY